MNSKYIFLLFCAILLLCMTQVWSANILVYFPAVNFSQKNSIWPFVQALAEKGHNVTFLSPQKKSSSTHKNINEITPKNLQDMTASAYNRDRFAIREAGEEKDFDYVGITTAFCKAVIQGRHSDRQLQKLFSNGTTFHLVIINSLLSECGFYVAKYFKAKTIHYTPATFIPSFYETYGTTLEAAWIPDYVYKFENVPISFWDRAYNALMPMYWQWIRTNQMSPIFQIIAKDLLKSDNVPSLYELEQQVSLVLINSHVSADFARTMPPLMVDVGGMSNWEKEKPIPEKFARFMDSANNGVVLITFGSTVLLNQVSERHQKMFFHLIEQFPKMKFLMRWEGTLPNFLQKHPENVMVSEWLPQREILRHPKVVAFITHGGISSIHEATYYAVPIIVLPLFSDQDFNAYRVDAQQVGIRVEIRGMTENTLVQALTKITTDNKYKKNAEKKSAIFKDRPQSPVKTAVFWTEFALRQNDTVETFRPQNKNLNTFQMRLMDVYLFEFVSASVALLIIIKFVCYAIKIFLSIIPDIAKTKN